jgi:HlyD family secretion protein
VIIASSILTARALAPIDLAIAHWKGFVAARQSWERLAKLLSILPVPAKPMALPKPAKSLAIENASVAPPGEQRLVVHDVSFALESGSGLGVIGPTALEREASRLEGERGQLIAQIAQTKGKISETELQIIQVDQDMRAEIGKDLAEIRAKVAELVEKKVAAEDQLKRIDIRAPQDGVVMQSTVHTVGGVIMQGDPIMLIVPETDALTVEVKIAPQDIDQIHFGQSAALRFSAFNQRTTPELTGAVSRISADVAQDQKSGAYFYTVRISVPDQELKRLEGLKLIPGMPVEAFIQTSERKALSYLVRPIKDQVVRAFREK